MSESRLRFAPSPTGNLHIGTLRTALFNWIYAKAIGATLVLRIEDTDLARSQVEFETNINQGLDWLGLTMDEGPSQGGGWGPYRQTERNELGFYKAHADRLLQLGYAYHCFCTEADLDQERATAEAEKRPYVYSGRCKALSPSDVQDKRVAQIPFTVKFSVPTGPPVRVKDVIRGDIDFDRSLIGDFVLVKSDQTPSYNFAVVVDDGMMGITDVVRGEDHISNTPKQILLFESLGYVVPKFAHLPMILGPDKSKLSKRHGATGVTEYRAQGFLADAVFNYLMLLGWSSADGKELMTRDEIIHRFTLERVSKSGAVFDVAKLRWMNGQYIRRQTPTELLTHVRPYLSDRVRVALEALGFDRFQAAIYSVRDNLDVLTDCNSFLEVYAMDADSWIAQVRGYSFGATDLTAISTFHAHVRGMTEWTVTGIESMIATVVTETGLGKGKVFKPIRIATSGQPSGPHLAELIWILGQSVVVQRMADVVALLNSVN